MATITLARSDLFPVGTSVGIYPAGSAPPGNQPAAAPGSAALASAAVAASGLLTVTDAAIASYTRYLAAASVGGEWRFCRCRSTLDTHDRGDAVGTGDTTSGSAALATVAASAGAFVIGQRITGPGIPAGTFLLDGSGAAWTMSATATATATGVALVAYGARAPIVVLGTGVTPQRIATGWRAQLIERRRLIGTS